jgi:tetratricopeptide (TPR) repeat protein
MDAKTHYDNGVNLYKNGSISDSIKEFIEAIKLEETGQTIPDKAALDKPIAELRMAMLSNPGDDTAHFNLGIVYHLKGYTINAIQEYEKILLHNPLNAEVHAYLGMEYLKKDKLTKAIKELEEAVRIDPISEYAKNNLQKVKDLKAQKRTK